MIPKHKDTYQLLEGRVRRALKGLSGHVRDGWRIKLSWDWSACLSVASRLRECGVRFDWDDTTIEVTGLGKTKTDLRQEARDKYNSPKAVASRRLQSERRKQARKQKERQAKEDAARARRDAVAAQHGFTDFTEVTWFELEKVEAAQGSNTLAASENDPSNEALT